MASNPDPSTRRENTANEQEGSKSQQALGPVRPTTEERADPDTTLAHKAATQDQKDSDEAENVRRALKSKPEQSAGTLLRDSLHAALPRIASCNDDSGSSTTQDHRTNTAMVFYVRERTCDPSTKLLDGVSTAPQRPTPVVKTETQAARCCSVSAISTDSFPHEHLAKGDHPARSTDAEIKLEPDNSTIKSEQETFSDHEKVPPIIVRKATNDFNNPENDTDVKVEVSLDPKNKSDKEKPSDAKDLLPDPNNKDAAIGQEGLAQKNAAAGNASPMDCQLLIQILEIDVDFTSVKPTCATNNQEGCRCGNKPSKESWEKACAILNCLISLGPCYDAERYAERLKVLACLVLCKRNHQDRAVALAEGWKKSLSRFAKGTDNSYWSRKDIQCYTPTPGPKSTDDSLPPPTKALGHLTLSTRFGDTNFNFIGIRQKQTEIRNFVPYHTKAKNQLDTGTAVVEAMNKDLLKSEMSRDGFIYIYWFPGMFGYIKIGSSGRPAQARLREWKKQCGHDPILVYPTSEEDMQRVPHVVRVEAIVHAALRERRRRELKCSGCNKFHKEWFEQSVSTAIALVRFWSAWMRKEPYAATVTPESVSKQKYCNTEQTWRLKDEFKEDPRTLSKIVPDDKLLAKTPHNLRPDVRRSRQTSGSRFRSDPEQPRRRSSRIADRNKRLGLVEGETTTLSFSAQFLAAAPPRRSRFETR